MLSAARLISLYFSRNELLASRTCPLPVRKGVARGVGRRLSSATGAFCPKRGCAVKGLLVGRCPSRQGGPVDQVAPTPLYLVALPYWRGGAKCYSVRG